MAQKTLYSVFRREKVRQIEKIKKHSNGILSVLFLIITGFIIVRNQPISVQISPIFIRKEAAMNFSEMRECSTPYIGSPLIKMTNHCLYIYSVIANYKDATSLLKVTLNIWDGTYSDNSDLVCCFRSHTSDEVTEILPQKFSTHHVQSSFRAGQTSCIVDMSTNSKPSHVALSKYSCSNLDNKWVPIKYADTNVDQIAVCTGVVHGRMIPERLTEWFELQKILGIEKVVTHVYNLNDDTYKVLKYYQKQGLLEILQYDIPGTIKAKRVRGFGNEEKWYPQYYNDMQIALLDCQERLQGYRYLIFNSFTELFIPRGEILNLYDLLEYRLSVEHPMAASFSFPVKTFITDWNKSDPENELFYLQYLLRAPVNKTQTRSIYIPSRTHSISDQSRHGYYENKELSEDIISFHEYRDCESYQTMCFSSFKYHDGDLFSFEKILKDNMKDVPPELRREF